MGERTTKCKDERKSDGLFLLVLFTLSVANIALGVLFLSGMKNAFVRNRFLLTALSYCGIVALLCGVAVWLTLSGREALSKGLMSVFLLGAFLLMLVVILQRTGFFAVVNSPERLQAYLEKAGVWMPIFYILLQFLQVVVLPIPSIVSTVAGVALFGAFWTMIYSLIGILVGSLLAFFIGRKLGGRAVAWMVGEDTLKKWQAKTKGKGNLFLSLMFVLPFFPDDILCFLAGLSTMTTGYFLAIIFFSRVIGIAATCYSFDFIPFNTWWGILLWGIILLGITLAFVTIYKNMNKIQSFLRKRKRKK